ncbi:MAG: ribosome biogenesis GTPase Der [Spirochaetota bacterium]|nr:MAG: ribosome biogenesis GTPase Der [Spirochaetota bacterium]
MSQSTHNSKYSPSHTDSMYDKIHLPIVAIVGKPNVGKSSLFNRLVKRRKAIVFDEPGVTRDINYEVIRHSNLTYRLADSTGYFSEKDETGSLAQEMNRRLIKEATLILLTCDIKDLSRLDYDIAELVRKSGKPCILVINKVDNDRLLDNVYDFFDLGYEEPVTVSAVHGKNISILRERIFEYLNKYDSYSDKHIDTVKPVIDIAIVGKPNVGKSSLLNLLVERPRSLVTPLPGTTRDTVDDIIEFEGIDFRFIDTAGIRKKKKALKSVEFFSILRAEKAIVNSILSILLIDAKDGISTQDKKIASIIVNERKGLIIAANKWDIAKEMKLNFHEFKENMYYEFPHIRFAEVLPISAKTGYNKIKLLKKVLTVYNNYNRKIQTPQLNEVISKLSHHDIQVKYGYQRREAPPVFEFFINKKVKEIENFKRYAINIIRKNFAFTGVPIEIYLRKKV